MTVAPPTTKVFSLATATTYFFALQWMLTDQWPAIPAPGSEHGDEICTSDLARVVHEEPEMQALVRQALADGGSPVLACLHPAGLSPEEFRAAWHRIAAESAGPSAWALEWLLAQAGPVQRAALTRDDYEDCLTAPAADVRFLGMQFLTGTYVLPSRRPITTRERVTDRIERAGRWVSGRGASSSPAWILPEKRTTRPTLRLL